MMITCPKCGFTQPRDRYCAKCGVDMENFKPSSPPVYKRILSNPLFYICLLFIFVCCAILFVRLHSREDLESRVKFLKGGPAFVTRSNKMVIPTETATAVNKHLPAMAPMNANGAGTQAASEDTKSSADSLQLHVLFAEVDHQTMENFRQESRTSGQFFEFGDFKAGPMQAGRKPNTERGVHILARSDEKLDHDHMTATANVGETKSDGAFLGVTYNVTLTRIDANSIMGEIEVVQNFHESQDINEPLVHRTYPSSTFEMSSGQNWMVTLNLPLVQQEDNDSMAPDGIMRIFQSPQYKSHQTEFTLFFEFDKPASNPNAGKNF